MKIKSQRLKIVAAVDKYGCNSIDHSNQEIKNLSVLVLLLLSSQTRDEITYSSVKNFMDLGRFGIEEIDKMTVNEINEIISKVGYHNKKAAYLKRIAGILKTAGLPRKLEDVIKLPGIGYKMGILYMFYVCGEITGVSVDTHVHRISNRIGLVHTKTPEKTQIELEKMFEKEEWPSINKVLVGFGQVICKPIKPLCNVCDAKLICPSSKNYMW